MFAQPEEKSETSPGYFRKKYPISVLLDSDWRKRAMWIESLSRACTLIPEVSFREDGSMLCCQQLRVRAKVFGDATSRTTLERLAAELDDLSLSGFVHGDINFKNLLFDGASWRLVDLEPSLRQRRKGRETLMYTPPYIARDDFKNDQLSQCTDKVGFYFFCRRLLRPIPNFLPRAEMQGIWSDGCVLHKHAGVSPSELVGITFRDLLEII